MVATDNKRVYSSLASLRGNSDFETVMSWIEEDRERLKELLAVCSTDKHQQIQGEAAALGRLAKMYREAPDVIKRLNTNDQVR